MSVFKVQESLNYRQLFFLDEYLIGHKGFISGGCFKNIFEGETIKDLDIFFESFEDFNNAVQLFDALVKDFPASWERGYKNNKVTSFIDTEKDIRIELIKSTFGKPVDLMGDFDFTVSKFSYFKEEVETGNLDDSGDVEFDIEYKVAFHLDFFEHLLLKRLVIDNPTVKYPMSTFERALKYSNYGYKMCKESKAKLAFAIMESPVESLKDLSASFYAGID